MTVVGHPQFTIGHRTGFHAVRRMHDRTRLFCNVLEVLADDLFQKGREAMALSLLEFATEELTPFLRWEDGELIRLLHRPCSDNGPARLLYQGLTLRHRTIAELLPSLADGLDTLSQARLPARPLEFALEAFRFSETVKLYLDWQRRELLPFALEALTGPDIAYLDATLAWRCGGESKTMQLTGKPN